jgi:predicted Zn-dependent protease with MMP-like domain
MPLRSRGTQARRHPQRRVHVPRERHRPFEDVVEDAIDALPPMIGRLLGAVAIVIEDEPSREQLRTSGLGRDESLYGLYEGVPLVEYDGDSVPMPNKITLFRLPLEEDFPDPLDLADEIRTTLIHELGHHAGFEEDRLHDLDLG